VTRARLGQRSGLGSGNSPRLEIPSFLFRHDDPAESPRAGQQDKRRNAEPYALPPRSLKLHLSGGLVFVQPLEARVSQQVISGPAGEGHFHHQAGLDPARPARVGAGQRLRPAGVQRRFTVPAARLLRLVIKGSDSGTLAATYGCQYTATGRRIRSHAFASCCSGIDLHGDKSTRDGADDAPPDLPSPVCGSSACRHCFHSYLRGNRDRQRN
jgi:hypothetical protein